MKTTSNFLMSAGLAMAVLLGACSKSKDTPDVTGPTNPEGTGRSKYVFVYSGSAASGSAGTYIVSTDDITTGKVSSKNNGVETDAYSFVLQNNTIFAQAYNNLGPVTPYRIYEDGQIGIAGRTVTTFRTGVSGTVNQDTWVGGGDPRSSGVGELFRFDAVNMQVSGKSVTDMNKITGTGENAVWTGLFQVDNKLYMPYYKFKPAGAGAAPWQGNYGSLDTAWVAVFSYPEMKYEKTIADGRTGFIGNWGSMQGLKQIENGDSYVWATSGSINKIKSKNHSGILRIKKGTEAFDKDYFFDVEALTGFKIARGEYIANGRFLMTIYTSAETGDVSGGRVKVAIVDINSKTVTYVKDVPEHEQGSFKMHVYYEGDGKTISYVLEDDMKQYYVYIINAETATGKKGVHIEGADNVTAFSKLKY